MSHIPNSAMPHAGPSEDAQQEQGGGATLMERASDLVGKAKANPKTAIAAGAAIVAGVAAAAAIPAVRARAGGRKSSGGSSKKKS